MTNLTTKQTDKTVSACSNCHNATMKIRGDVTKYYVCGVCHRPCDPTPTHSPTEPISLCQSCYCMTKTIDGRCGKCKADKPTVEKWEFDVSNYVHQGDYDDDLPIYGIEEANKAIKSLVAQSVQEAKAEREKSYKQGGLDCVSMIAENGEGMTWENRKARERLWTLMWEEKCKDDLLTSLRKERGDE